MLLGMQSVAAELRRAVAQPLPRLSWTNLIASIPSRLGYWEEPDPSLVAHGCLRRLAASFELLALQHGTKASSHSHEDQNEAGKISSLLDYLVTFGLRRDNAIAHTVCVFFLEVYVLLWDVLTSTPLGSRILDLFSAFFGRLKSGGFSHLVTFKACILALLAVAAPVSLEKVKQVRQLNDGMSWEESVKSEDFTDVPLASVDLVRCGLALQASLDAENDVPCSRLPLTCMLSLANGFLPLYITSHLPVYLERFVRFLDLRSRCNTRCIDISVAAKFITDLVNVLDQEWVTDSDGRLQSLVLAILRLLTPIDKLKVIRTVVQNKPCSSEVLWLVQAVENVPLEDQDSEFFSELRSLLDYLFTCGAIYFYPTDDEMVTVLVAGRSALEQLHAVLVLVHVYLYFIRMEMEGGGKDVTGLLAPEARRHAREKWLAPLQQQAQSSVVTELQIQHRHAADIVAYALDVIQEPSLILRAGLPPI